MTRLYIIGNGFDRHQGMATDYADFGNYLSRADRELHDLLDEYFPTDQDGFWSEFEENLAAFDADSLIENSGHFIVPYGDDDWSDAYHHDYAWELDRVVKALSDVLVAAFADWVRQIPIPAPTPLSAPRLAIDPAARFLNFNYTATLQSLYGVAEDHIWHIHGRASDAAERLILGHGWCPAPAETYAAQLDRERADTRLQEGADVIDRYFRASFKPTARIVADQQARFQSFADIDEVRVLGHSLADVDLPYLEAVAANVRTDARWRISYHLDPSAAQRQFAKISDPARAIFLPISAV